MGKRRTHEELFEANNAAMTEGPSKKVWTKHDMRSVRLWNERQHDAARSWAEGNNVALIGSAGTGKTFLAMLMAASSLVSDHEEFERIIAVRSAASARDIGFLPGTAEEKGAVYEEPFDEALGYLFCRDKTYADMKAAGKVEFRLTSFLRGVNWHNAIIVVDEAQNMTFQELYTILTRVGRNSRIILTGDTRQVDLTQRGNDFSGLEYTLDILRDVACIECVEFTRYDVVRSDFVRAFIGACEDRAARN